MKYAYEHQDHESTVPRAELPDSVLVHLHERGFALVGKADGLHVPTWLLEIIRIQERRGDAGGRLDWHEVWTTLTTGPATRTRVHKMIESVTKEHGLNREHADEAAIEMLIRLTHNGSEDYDHEVQIAKMKDEYASQLEESRAQHEAARLVDEENLRQQAIEERAIAEELRDRRINAMAKIEKPKPGLFTRVKLRWRSLWR